ncbi:MAG: pin [Nitrospira sp.]|nr:pin [Nitrospira sp.]
MKPRKAAIYARVSTDGQTTTNQLQELQEVAKRNGWTVVHEFVDRGISGAKGREHRPAFDALWQGVGRKDFDVVMVWAVDRLGRSLQHLVNFLTELHAKKVDLFIHQQGIDTTTPGRKALFGMLGIFAEFERSMIQERVKAGIKRVRNAPSPMNCTSVHERSGRSSAARKQWWDRPPPLISLSISHMR